MKTSPRKLKATNYRVAPLDSNSRSSGFGVAFLQPGEEFGEIAGQSHFEVDHFAGDGMHEPQFGGVERDGGVATLVLHGGAEERLMVHFLAADEMPLLGQMDPDLVRAARFQPALDDSVAV